MEKLQTTRCLTRSTFSEKIKILLKSDKDYDNGKLPLI